MATWTIRGMDKFLCEDVGFPTLVYVQPTFASSTHGIFALFYPRHQLRLWAYNLKDSLPWRELSSISVSASSLIVAFVYNDVLYCILTQGSTFQVRTYSIADGIWRHDAFENYDGDGIQALPCCLCGDKYLLLSVETTTFTQFLETDDRYSNENVIPSSDEVISFETLNLSTRRWERMKTRLSGFYKSEARDLCQALRGSPGWSRCYGVVGAPNGESLLAFHNLILHRNTAFSVYEAYELCLTGKIWSKISIGGEIPTVFATPIVIGDYVYVYGGRDDEIPLELRTTKFATVNMNARCQDVYRFDPYLYQWEVIAAAGSPPAKRWLPQVFAVDGKILVFGGIGADPKREGQLHDAFWFRGNEYNLDCRCLRCQGLLAQISTKRNITKITEEAGLIFSMNRFQLSHLKVWVKALRAMSPPNVINLDNWGLNIFREIKIKSIFPARERFFDVHVLDLSPTLTTLSMIVVKDQGLDTSRLPPRLHFNFNTMHAFGPERLGTLRPREVKLIEGGKGDSRREAVNVVDLLVEKERWRMGFLRASEWQKWSIIWRHLFRLCQVYVKEVSGRI